MADWGLDLAHSAVVSLDLQVGVVSVYVKDTGFIARASQLLQSARRAGMPVIHVRVEFRPGVPEASARNTFLSAVKASVPHQRFFQGQSGEIHPELAGDPSDLVVTKSRISAFVGTDLDLLLRAREVHTLILFGAATSGAVLSTTLQAADLDYRVVVVGDCCADLDPDAHRMLIDKIFPRLGAVASARDVEASLARP